MYAVSQMWFVQSAENNPVAKKETWLYLGGSLWCKQSDFEKSFSLEVEQ